MAEEDTKKEQEQKYDLVKIKEDPNYIFHMDTRGKTVVPISLKGLEGITPVPAGSRAPNNFEYMMLVETALGQQANPYAKECGLMPVKKGGFHYEVWIGAQVRLRKAEAQSDYDGYQWGWITEDGVRHKSGQESKATPDTITGVWGKVYRKGQQEPFYHETFLHEYKKESKSGRGSWDERPITMLLKVNRDQTHKFAYADKMGNLCTENEIRAAGPEATSPTFEQRRKDLQAERKQIEDAKVTDTPKPEPSPEPIKEMLQGCVNKLSDKIEEYWGDKPNEFQKHEFTAELCKKVFGGKDAREWLDEGGFMNPNLFDSKKVRLLNTAVEDFDPDPTADQEPDDENTEEQKGKDGEEEDTQSG